jgi:hypothetical protein
VNGKPLAIAASGVAIAAVAVSIWLNPPAENRARSFDEIRAQRLSYLKFAIDSYFKEHMALPARLDQLRFHLNSMPQIDWHDPATGRPFEYAVLGKNSYRLCAMFERSSAEDGNSFYGFPHGSGRSCFEDQSPSSYGAGQFPGLTGEMVGPSVSSPHPSHPRR